MKDDEESIITIIDEGEGNLPLNRFFRGDPAYELQKRISARAAVSDLTDEELVNKVKRDFDSSSIYEIMPEDSEVEEIDDSENETEIVFFR